MQEESQIDIQIYYNTLYLFWIGFILSMMTIKHLIDR